MQKAMIHLWYDNDAADALARYTSLFDESGIDRKTIIHNTPNGHAEVFEFHLHGLHFQALNGGPGFEKNAAISLSVICDTAQEVDRLHAALLEGGNEIMALGAYPFSPCYAWVQDRWGLHWQLILEPHPYTQKIVPTLLFSGPVNGKAEEAMAFYTGLLPNSSVDVVSRYGQGEAHTHKAKTKYGAFTLGGTRFSAMDNAMDDPLPFNEAVSIVVHCQDQAEVDRLWESLSSSPEHEACGWVKDRYGVSWQIVPEALYDFAINQKGEYDPGVTQAMLQMKKLDIAALRAAKSSS